MVRISKYLDAIVQRARSISFPGEADRGHHEGMLRLERWSGDEPGSAPPEPNLRTALLETFAHFRKQTPRGASLALSTAVVLDDGTGQPWTVRIERGQFSLEAGRARDAETTIVSDPLTLASIVRGKRSGIEPYLRG